VTRRVDQQKFLKGASSNAPSLPGTRAYEKPLLSKNDVPTIVRECYRVTKPPTPHSNVARWSSTDAQTACVLSHCSVESTHTHTHTHNTHTHTHTHTQPPLLWFTFRIVAAMRAGQNGAAASWPTYTAAADRRIAPSQSRHPAHRRQSAQLTALNNAPNSFFAT
jgi:hypothetical protein